MSLSKHTKSDQSDHNTAKEIIAKELRNRTGKANAISSKGLAEQTPVSASTVRDLIPEVRREFYLPIASGNGYYLIDDQSTFLEVMDQIEAEIETRKQTQRELAKVWNSEVVE